MTEREITLIQESSQEQELVITREYNGGNGYDAGYSDGYDTGYNNGYETGQETGYNNGYQQGHGIGYSEGKTQGYSDGYNVGHTDGESAGIEIGKTAGKDEQYNEFWDSFQENGERTSYPYAFYQAFWNDTTYNPKYPIVIQSNNNTTNTFAYSTITDTKVEIVIKSQVQQIFYRCYDLVTIRKLIFDGTVTSLSNIFRDCESLTNLTAEGTIGGSLDLSYSPLLTHDSIMSVITCLKDYAGSGTTYTLTLGAKNLAKLTDTEKAIATQKGWTLA